MVQPANDNFTGRTSVLVAHPYALVREGLCHIIERAGFIVCNQVDCIEALLTSAAALNPDVVLIDFRILRSDEKLVDTLKNTIGSVVAIVTVPEQIEEAPGALKAGAKGYLSYSQTREEFLQSLSLLSKGSVIVSNVASEQVQSAIHRDKINTGNVTGREKDVVKLVARGATNREIADKLMVSQHTIKIHLHSILNKLNLRNRQQIAAYAIKQGLVEDIQTEDFFRTE